MQKAIKPLIESDYLDHLRVIQSYYNKMRLE